jgi:hypothetical protein
MKGKVQWEGNLDEMRYSIDIIHRDRDFDVIMKNL